MDGNIIAIMTARNQITLDPELRRRALDRARRLGLSLDEYVRRLVADDVGADRTSVDVAELFDLGDSGESDIATFKDAYLGAAAAAKRQPGR